MNGISALIVPLILTFIALIILPIGFISQSILFNQKRFEKYFFFEEYKKIYKPNKFFNTATYFKSPLFYTNMLLVIIVESGCAFLLFAAFEKPYFNIIDDPNSLMLRYISSTKPTEELINIVDTNSLLCVFTYHFKPWTPVIIVSVLVIIAIAVLFYDSYFLLKHINASNNAKMLKIRNIEFLQKQGVTEYDINRIKTSLSQYNNYQSTNSIF